MSTFDHDSHDLLLTVVVLGGFSKQFLSGLALSDGELRLGEVQGWHPRIHFHTFGVDPWADSSEAARLERVAPSIDGLVLTDALIEGTHFSSAAIERLSRLLGPVKLGIPVTIFGGPALAQEWSTLTGIDPVYVAGPVSENVMPTVKALVKVLLKVQPTGKTIPPPSAH
jgi:hypothetical protein